MSQSPKELRKQIRTGAFQRPTSGAAGEFVQANVVIVPKAYAFDFFLFVYRNKKSCPLIDVFGPGETESQLAKGSDIRTDIPKYRIYRDGKLDGESNSIEAYWNDDLVTFLIGCSFTFEKTLMDANISLRHIEENKNVAMYVTNQPTNSAGIFSGPLVVSMRPIKNELIDQAAEITSQYPNMHGAPIHVGNPEEIGIQSIDQPDFGDPIEIKENEQPVFWACGVTPQMAAVTSRIPFMITHSPGHMFVTDITNEEFLANHDAF